jgi:tripartite-type tricarboxylate transporter receptor subunit TctC
MTVLTRRAVIAGLTSFAALPARSVAALPSGPITIVHGYAPGGPVDTVARIVAERLSNRLDRQVIVDPRAGASGTIAAAQVGRAAADGSTLIILPGSHAATAALYRKLPYRPVDDFSMIGLIGEHPFVFVTYTEHAIRSIADLLDVARSRNTPVLYGTPGTGSPQHLSGELLSRMANVHFQHVPYRGSAPGVTDLLAGRIDFMIDAPTLMLEFIASGKLHALGVTSTSRSLILPDVPTISETGLSEYVVTSWFGLAGPAGLPASVVARVNQALVELLAEPAVIERLRSLGETPRSSSPGEFRARIAADIEKWTGVIASANIERI